MEIGERIKQKRKALGLTLEEVGKAVGVSKSTVRKWETGYIANMRRDKIPKLASVLQTTPAELMGWEEPEAPVAPDPPERWKNAEKLSRQDRFLHIAVPHLEALNKFIVKWIATAEVVDQGVLELLNHSGKTVSDIREKYLATNPDAEDLIAQALSDQDLCERVILIEYTGGPAKRNLYFKSHPRNPTYEFTLYVLIEKILRLSPDERVRLIKYLDSPAADKLLKSSQGNNEDDT